MGRAAEKLMTFFPLKAYTYFHNQKCRRNFLGGQHVHIDGAGHVFSGTCVGIIVGRVDLECGPDLVTLWTDSDLEQHPVIGPLMESGPTGLLTLAFAEGFVPMAGYANKCHLCFHIRKFLYRNHVLTRYLGPGPCYGTCES